MPRYLVQRTFKNGLVIPVSEDGATTCRVVVDNKRGPGRHLGASYVSQDKSTSYCVYDGPSPDAIRKAAELNGLPVDQITEVTVLDPYFYH